MVRRPLLQSVAVAVVDTLVCGCVRIKPKPGSIVATIWKQLLFALV